MRFPNNYSEENRMYVTPPPKLICISQNKNQGCWTLADDIPVVQETKHIYYNHYLELIKSTLVWKSKYEWHFQ